MGGQIACGLRKIAQEAILWAKSSLSFWLSKMHPAQGFASFVFAFGPEITGQIAEDR